MPPKRKTREDVAEEAPGTNADSASQGEGTVARRQPMVVSFNTLLEDSRQYHDDIERLERLICEEFRSFHGGSDGQSSPRAHRPRSNIRNTYNARLFHEYAVLDMLEQVQDKSAKLLAMYEDVRGERAEEMANGLKGVDALSTFYGYVKSIDEYFSGEEAVLVEGYDEGCRRALKRVEPGVLEGRVRGLFSGEEGLGRYLDVEDLYKDVWRGIWDDFTSKHKDTEEVDASDSGAIVPVVDKVNGANGAADVQDNSFASYLRRLGYGHEEDLTSNYKMKNHGKYVPYLRQLVAYLSGLYMRAHPLKEWRSVEREVREAFDGAWEDGLKAKWAAMVGVDADDQQGWAQQYKTVDALEKGLGGEKIKVILASMGLKCGGTVQQRAERLWSVKGKALNEIEPSLFAGGHKRKGAGKASNGIADAAKASASTRMTANTLETNTGNTPGDSTHKMIARLEFTVKYLCTMPSLLSKQHMATIEKLEKRHAQTYDEFVADMEAELENDLGENVFADEDEDEEVYNPLKIPLGFDGKPIPYWMYKLHGLNHEFTCEICGNTTYFGRRQFEKHFLEAKHVGGLKALGISSSREFHEITGISEALGLWNTLQAKKKEAMGAAEEEVEDAEGNIMSREMLSALQMQGVFGDQ